MAKNFRITTAWVTQTDENPWLLSAYDEYSEDAWNGTPKFFEDDVKKAIEQGDEVRIVDILVDYDKIEERFSATTIDGNVAE